MVFDSTIHNRRSIRLKNYDYSRAGAYFITLCCQDRRHRFGKIENGLMILNDCGKIAAEEWINLAQRFPSANFDIFQIMPNHMHGIIILNLPKAGSHKFEAGASHKFKAGASPKFEAGASPASTVQALLAGALIL